MGIQQRCVEAYRMTTQDPTAALRDAILRALTTCPHDIEKGQIVLYHDPAQSSRNALTQVADRIVAALAQPQQPAGPLIARALSEWDEEDGAAMWWAWCGHEWAGEPAWCGKPIDSDWPGYHTHWTPHPEFPATALPNPSQQEDV